MKRILAVGAFLAFGLGAGAATKGDTPPRGRYGTIAVQTTATKMFTAAAGRNTLSVYNMGPNTIYCGFDNVVATTTGTPVSADAMLSVDIVYNGSGDQSEFYCITTVNQTSPADTRWMQVK